MYDDFTISWEDWQAMGVDTSNRILDVLPIVFSNFLDVYFDFLAFSKYFYPFLVGPSVLGVRHHEASELRV